MVNSPRAVERMLPPRAPFDVMNRSVRWALSGARRSSRLGRHLLLLHVTGRRSGKVIDVPVAYRGQADGRLLVLTSSPWRVNLRERSEVEVTLRGQRRSATAELVEDPTIVADVYQDLITQVGRRRATRELGVRVNVDRDPTLDELRDAVVVDHLSLVYLSVGEPS